MSPTLTSQGLVLATAMAVSAATAVLFDLLRDKYFPQIHHRNHLHQQQPPLKPCLLSSGSKKTEKESKKRKKVKFAEDVKDPKGNGESYRRGGERKSDQVEKNGSCGNEFQKIPANHAALYNGMMKHRVHKMGFSY